MLFDGNTHRKAVSHSSLSGISVWVSVHHMLSLKGFPVTSVSHNHLTSIIGLLLFIYLLWQEKRGEVTQSHQRVKAGSGVARYATPRVSCSDLGWIIMWWLKPWIQHFYVIFISQLSHIIFLNFSPLKIPDMLLIFTSFLPQKSHYVRNTWFNHSLINYTLWESYISSLIRSM